MSRKIEIIKKYPALVNAIESFGYETTEQFWTAMNDYSNNVLSDRDKFAIEFALFAITETLKAAKENKPTPKSLELLDLYKQSLTSKPQEK